MKYIIAVLSVCLVIVTAQNQNRPPPPPGSQAPLTVAAAAPPPSQQTPAARPPRPKGCSPGCGPTEICAELGSSYCKGNTVCSVCIKMSSIRFPASALAGMFSQQQQKAAVVPAQPIVAQQPAANPFGPGAEEVSIMELASRQRRIQDKISNEFGTTGTSGGFPPRPPPVDVTRTVRPVNDLDPAIKPINDPSAKPTPNPFGKMATDVKYPIVATVHEPSQHIHEAAVVLDQGQLSEIHSQYQQGNVKSTLTPKEKTKAEFDFASFKRYQTWLKQQQVPVDQSAAEEFALFQKYREFVKLHETQKGTNNAGTSASNTLPLVPSPTNAPDAASTTTKTLPTFDYAAFKQQWQQDSAQGAAGTIAPPTGQPPATGTEPHYLDYATIQRLWHEQQQQQQQQANLGYQVQQNNQHVVNYDPQPAYNDPFDIFGFNDPMPPQQNQLGNNMQAPMNNNNNMFGLMMFEGLGFGNGFGLGF